MGPGGGGGTFPVAVDLFGSIAWAIVVWVADEQRWVVVPGTPENT